MCLLHRITESTFEKKVLPGGKKLRSGLYRYAEEKATSWAEKTLPV